MSARISDRSQICSIAADTRWGKETNRTEATRPARDRRWAKFLEAAGPEGTEAERHQRARNLQRAAMKQMARARWSTAEKDDQ